MATYDLEEQEQLAELKAWWKQYGNLLTNVLLVAAVAVLAWQGWGWYQRGQSGQASGIYHLLQQAVLDRDMQRIKATSGELVEKYSGSSYAPLAALTAAKAFVSAGDVKTAKVQLQWVVDHGKDEVRDLARLRLAGVLLDEKAYDQALKQLEGVMSPAFEARFQETRGDVLVAQGKRAEASGAFQAALGKLDAAKKAAGSASADWQMQSDAVSREILQQKLDSVGGAK